MLLSLHLTKMAANTSDFVHLPDIPDSTPLNQTRISTPIQKGDLFKTPKGQIAISDSLRHRLSESLANSNNKKRNFDQTLEPSHVELRKTTPPTDQPKRAKANQTPSTSFNQLEISSTDEYDTDNSIMELSYTVQHKPLSPIKSPPRITLNQQTAKTTQLYAGSTNRSFTLSDNYNVDTIAGEFSKLGLPAAEYKRCGEGFLITVLTQNIADQFRSVDRLNKLNILIRPPIWETQVRGVLNVDPSIDKGTLQRHAKEANDTAYQPQISYIYRINSNNKPTPYVVATFEGKTLPETISFGGHRSKPVTPYLRKPLQCTKCLLYGHNTKNCTRHQACTKCGSQSHTYQTCIRGLWCIHCKKQGHSSLSKTCPTKQIKLNKLNPKHQKAATNYANPKPNLSIHLLDIRPLTRPRSSTPNESYNEEMDFTTKQIISNSDLETKLNRLTTSIRRENQLNKQPKVAHRPPHTQKPKVAARPTQSPKPGPTPKPRLHKPYFNQSQANRNPETHSQLNNQNRTQNSRRNYSQNTTQTRTKINLDPIHTQICSSLIIFTAKAMLNIIKPNSPAQLHSQIKALYTLAEQTNLFHCSYHLFKQQIIDSLPLPTNFNTRRPTMRYNTNLRKPTRY